MYTDHDNNNTMVFSLPQTSIRGYKCQQYNGVYLGQGYDTTFQMKQVSMDLDT